LKDPLSTDKGFSSTIHDGDKKRNTLAKVAESESSSESEDGEEQALQQELIGLI
jgi:hypothetical protein